MKRIWVTESGIIHHRKPEMEAKEYVETPAQQGYKAEYYKPSSKTNPCIKYGEMMWPMISDRIAMEIINVLNSGQFTPAPTPAPTEKVDFSNLMLPLVGTLTEKEEYSRRIGWNQAIDYFRNLANTGRLR